MRLYEEICKSVDGALANGCVIVPNGGGYFEGVKCVEDFSPERLTLRFFDCQAAVEGRGLSIKKYGDGDLEISGKITAFYLLEQDSFFAQNKKKQDAECEGEIKKKYGNF